MGEKEIFFIGTRSFKSKKDDTYFIIDYVRLDKMIPKSDFISATEFVEINKKMKDKNLTKCFGLFKDNDFDKIYCYGVK